MLFGIIGNGFVGNATQLLTNDTDKCIIYDIDPSKSKPPNLQFTELKKCNIIFICVPTPVGESGQCDTSIVESCVRRLHEIIDPRQTFIVCRSTVIMGTCDRLGIYHMPEFLTETNWKQDFLSCKTWIFGQPENPNPLFESTIRELFNNSLVSGDLYFVQNKCSEMIKYARNTFLATKVSFCNELYSVCNKIGVDYKQVQELFAADPRIGKSHTMVPGPDDHYGFGGHCLPKDLSALVTFMQQQEIPSYLLQNVQQRNNYDRDH